MKISISLCASSRYTESSQPITTTQVHNQHISASCRRCHYTSIIPLTNTILHLSPKIQFPPKPQPKMSLTLSPSSSLLRPSSPTRLPTTLIHHPLTHFSRPRLINFLNVSCTATSTPTSPPTTTPALQSLRSRAPNDTNVLVVGSTGYIGRFVVRELAARGYNVVAVARDRSGIRGRNDRSQTLADLSPTSTVVFSDVADLQTLTQSLLQHSLPIHAVVSCLASRNGGIADSWNIDYSATRNSLLAGRRLGASHFVLLSAICVQKPLLEFQRAKLKFEADLIQESARDANFTYSIVRPTAFFKSLAGQVELVRDGKPYVMFGDGKLCACKPISEEDLARFIADCLADEDKVNRVLPIGGPGKALTPAEQGEMLFRLLGKEPKFLKVPIGVMDFAIRVLDFLAKVFPGLEDAAEFGRIGRYYAAESMLVLDPETGEYSGEKTPSYGKDTLEEFFERVIREGMAGQELGEQTII